MAVILMTVASQKQYAIKMFYYFLEYQSCKTEHSGFTPPASLITPLSCIIFATESS